MEYLNELDNSNSPEFAIENALETVSSKNDYCSEEVISDGKKYHRCTFPNCGKIFRYQSEVKRHKFTHTLQRPVTCPFPDCGKKFKYEEALKDHARTHTGETPYKCEEPGCGQSFVNKGALRYHILKHKGEKEYRCSFSGCDKSFWTMAQLRQHESAQNYHQKISNRMLYRENQEHLKVRKLSENSNKEPAASESKVVQEIEEKARSKKEMISSELLSDDLQVQFGRIIKFILNENDAIKTKLALYEKLKWLSQESDGMDDKVWACSETEEQTQFSTQEFSEERIFQFLKFND